MSTIPETRKAVQPAGKDTASAPFKICNMCLASWQDFESFAADPLLVVNGYQAYFDNPDEGLILFTHKAPGCGSTLALRAGTFRPYYHGPEYKVRNEGAETCGGHCHHADDVEACHARCDMRWVRDILQQLRAHRTT